MDEFLSITDGSQYIHVNRPTALALFKLTINYSKEQEWKQISRVLQLYAHRRYADSSYTVTTNLIQQLQDLYNSVK